MRRLTYSQAVERARELVEHAPGRVILGIAGKPGSCKSTLAARVLSGVPGSVCVGMDAFHLAHSTLTAQGEVERKGAVHTFDGAGYVALLRRIRSGEPIPSGRRSSGGRWRTPWRGRWRCGRKTGSW